MELTLVASPVGPAVLKGSLGAAVLIACSQVVPSRATRPRPGRRGRGARRAACSGMGCARQRRAPERRCLVRGEQLPARFRSGRRLDGEDGRHRKREFLIDNLLVRIHFIIVIIRWAGLAPCEFKFPFPGFLEHLLRQPTGSEPRGNSLKGLKGFYLKAKARIWP